MADDLPELAFPDQAAFEAWLEHHHGTEPGLWIRIAKKALRHPDGQRGAEAIEARLVLRLDRRAAPARRRDDVPAALHPAPLPLEVVEDQPREGGGPHRGGARAPGRARRGPGGPRTTGGGTPRMSRRAGSRSPTTSGGPSTPSRARRPSSRELTPTATRSCTASKMPSARRTRARRIEKFVDDAGPRRADRSATRSYFFSLGSRPASVDERVDRLCVARVEEQRRAGPRQP